MLLNKKNIFLVDGIGALLTAFNVGVLLVHFNEYIGMPIRVLYPLALAGVVFAMYSLTNHFKGFRNGGPRLSIIAVANLVYCCITILLMLRHSETLTYLGYLYFIVEVGIVVILSIYELSLSLDGRKVKER